MAKNQAQRKYRQEIGGLAARYLADEITYEQFLMAVSEDTEDDEVSELIDLIEHEPKNGGIFGASKSEYARHMSRVRQLVQLLVKDVNDAGAV